MLKPFYYSIAIIAAFSQPAFAVYDRQDRCVVTSQDTVISVDQSQIYVSKGEDVVLFLPHVWSANSPCLTTVRVTFSNEQYVWACEGAVLKSADTKQPNHLRRTENGAVLIHRPSGKDIDPVQLSFDCEKNGELY